MNNNQRYVVWFSCGATSAVAAKLITQAHENVEVAYCDTGSEHTDNERFMDDVSAWIGHPITILRSEKYSDIWDVFNKTRFIVGPKGARCTTELKKLLRMRFQRGDDVQVFGFDATERDRIERFKGNNPEVNLSTPLFDANLTKTDCFDILRRAGIKRPAMYDMGYRNNNCIGCVKGGLGYWNKIRTDFPDVFNRMANTERDIGAAVCKLTVDGVRGPIYLDELPDNVGTYAEEPDTGCGLFCGDFLEGSA
jgi:hypothetical protein